MTTGLGLTAFSYLSWILAFSVHGIMESSQRQDFEERRISVPTIAELQIAKPVMFFAFCAISISGFVLIRWWIAGALIGAWVLSAPISPAPIAAAHRFPVLVYRFQVVLAVALSIVMSLIAVTR